MIESQKISQFTPFCWNNDIKVLHGKSQEWTCDPWFVKILRTQRSSEVHVDSTFLHRCRVGALIYDSEAGWSHKDPQSITMLSVASADPGLNMSGIPSPRSSDTHTHTSSKSSLIFASYLQHPSTIPTTLTIGGGWTTQDMLQCMRCMPDSEFSSLGAGFGLWFSPSPLQLVQLTRSESQIHADALVGGLVYTDVCGRNSVCHLSTSCCLVQHIQHWTLLWFGNTPCGSVK